MKYCCAHRSHQVSNTGLWWPELASDLGTSRDLFCESKYPENDPAVFSLRVRMEEGPILGSISRQQSRTIPNYLIRLLPPLVLHNCLPYSLDVKIPQLNNQVSSCVKPYCVQKINKFFVKIVTHRCWRQNYAIFYEHATNSQVPC